MRYVICVGPIQITCYRANLTGKAFNFSAESVLKKIPPVYNLVCFILLTKF
jgi:hypothetical protein